jgi:hypothetical protein
MRIDELKAKAGCARIGAVDCSYSKRVVFFRQPTSDEFNAIQAMDAGPEKETATREYVLNCIIGSAPMPAGDDFGDTVVEESRDPWTDRVIATEGPAIVTVGWARCVNDLGGGGAKRTRFF